LALHFYMNGTAGSQDGEEISNGDFTNPVLFDGFYPAAGVTLYKKVPVYIRADAGETYYLVQVEIRGDSARKFYFKECIGTNGGGNYGSGSRITFGGQYFSPGAVILGVVGDTNVELNILASASGDESDSPDLTTKIYARSCYNGAS